MKLFFLTSSTHSLNLKVFSTVTAVNAQREASYRKISSSNDSVIRSDITVVSLAILENRLFSVMLFTSQDDTTPSLPPLPSTHLSHGILDSFSGSLFVSGPCLVWGFTSPHSACAEQGRKKKKKKNKTKYITTTDLITFFSQNKIWREHKKTTDTRTDEVYFLWICVACTSTLTPFAILILHSHSHRISAIACGPCLPQSHDYLTWSPWPSSCPRATEMCVLDHLFIPLAVVMK